jgi:hypothetical protein
MGDSFGRGMNAASGAGNVSAPQGGATILGSASSASVSSGRSGRPLGPVARGGGLGFSLDPAPREGGVLSPLSFQPGNIGGRLTSVSLGGISLEGMPVERPRGGGRPLKTYPLLKFKGPALLAVCGGVIGGGGRFCAPQAAECIYTSHQTKAWEAGSMEPGLYILDGAAMKAFLEPCLPMNNATHLAMRRAVLEDGKQTIAAWTAIFRHL